MAIVSATKYYSGHSDVMGGSLAVNKMVFKFVQEAEKIASFLSKHKKITVLYPYKKGTKDYKMWKKYYKGSSGLMGLKIKSRNISSIDRFVNSLRLFGYGYSWGGFESLALHQKIKFLQLWIIHGELHIF